MIFLLYSTFTINDKISDTYDLVTAKWFSTLLSNYKDFRWKFTKVNKLDDYDKIRTRHSSTCTVKRMM